MATSLKFSPKTLTTGPPTRQQQDSLLHVQTNYLGASVRCTTGLSRWARMRGWFHKHRSTLFGAATVGAVVGATMCAPALGVAAVCAAAGLCSKRGPLHERPPALMEAYAASVLGVGDVTTVGGKLADDLQDEGDRLITKAVRKWVRKAKLHFGEVKDTPADQLCVKKWLAEQMKAEDMRDKDARGLVPVVAFLSTVPDADDAVATFMRQSGVVSIMRILGGGGGGA